MASKDPKRPNILFILTDDQGCWALGCAGNEEIRTPSLDRLAETGMRFENFFCTSPVCSPARASIVTGRIPSQHGVHDWLRAGNTVAPYEREKDGVLIEYLKHQPGYTDLLATAGYTCGISGKWHLGDSHHPQKSFAFWEVHAKGGGPYYSAPMIRNGEVYEEPRYVTDVITENALDFLEEQKASEKPFYLSVHYTAPHSPWQREHHPPELYDSYYHGCPFDSVPGDLTPPEWAQHLSIPVKDEETRRVLLSGYYAAVTAMDANVGRLLEWLEQSGLRENTLVCFMSDNGMNMGHHGVFGKGNATFPLNMFDESVKVPFIVSRPKYVPEGVLRTELLSQYDFMPTLLEYLGIENPEADRLPGTSFAALLRRENYSGPDRVVVFDEYGPVRMVRNHEWKYVHRYPYGPHELYDLESDPGETQNLANDDGHRETVRKMKSSLDEWFARYVDPLCDGTHDAVTGSGQLGLAGPAGKGGKCFSDAILTRRVKQ
jgi:arylsulfatase A-like enzyme